MASGVLQREQVKFIAEHHAWSKSNPEVSMRTSQFIKLYHALRAQ